MPNKKFTMQIAIAFVLTIIITAALINNRDIYSDRYLLLADDASTEILGSENGQVTVLTPHRVDFDTSLHDTRLKYVIHTNLNLRITFKYRNIDHCTATTGQEYAVRLNIRHNNELIHHVARPRFTPRFNLKLKKDDQLEMWVDSYNAKACAPGARAILEKKHLNKMTILRLLGTWFFILFVPLALRNPGALIYTLGFTALVAYNDTARIPLLDFGNFRLDELAQSETNFALTVLIISIGLSAILNRLKSWLYALILTLSTILLFVLLLVPVIELGYFQIFDRAIKYHDWVAVFQSSIYESLEYFDSVSNLAWFLIPTLWIFLPGVFLHRYRSKQAIKPIANSWRITALLAIPLLISAFAPTAYISYVPALNSFNQYFTEVQALKAGIEKRKKLGNVSASKDAKGETYIIVVGESLTRHHMSLYGYIRNTTPNLNKLAAAGELIVATETFANDISTLASLSYAITGANDLNKINYRTAASAIEVFNAAGFETYWISNQVNQHNAVGILGALAKHVEFLNPNTGSVDGRMLPSVDQAISDNPGKNKAIFLHIQGSHTGYHNRYDDSLSNPYKDKNYVSWATHKDINGHFSAAIDHYDNSILYNDLFVKQLIDKLSSTDSPTALVYFADHGDDVVRGIAHRFSSFTFDMLDVPLFAWFSDEYKKHYPKVPETFSLNREKQYSNANLFHLLIGVLGVSSDLYVPALDISHEQFNDTTLTASRGNVRVEDKRNRELHARRNLSLANGLINNAQLFLGPITLPRQINLANLSQIGLFFDMAEESGIKISAPESKQALSLSNLVQLLQTENVTLPILLRVPTDMNAANVEKTITALNTLPGDVFYMATPSQHASLAGAEINAQWVPEALFPSSTIDQIPPKELAKLVNPLSKQKVIILPPPVLEKPFSIR